MDQQDRNAHRVFVSALELDGEQRGEFLSRECGDDNSLRRAVDKLLSAVRDSEGFLESPAISSLGIGQETKLLNRTIDSDAIEGLRIIRRLGVGGMAEVYEAEQESPHRRVAVKILHGALTGTSALERFHFEADTLARLNHPGIAQIFGSGVCADSMGRQVPYFVMEYIPDAITILEYVKEHRLDLRGRLSLFVDFADAVQFGHQAGVIHRDLKPGNILVDESGRPRVIDFGVAKAASSEAEQVTISCERGNIIGTLNYMSPEQCAGSQHIDTRCDVYSLGVILYEFVANTRPYSLSSTSILDAIKIVQAMTPPRPSQRVNGVPVDLDSIVMKALEKEPERRYASVSELAADVRRFLNDRPVLARPPTVAYQLRMFAKRNRALVAAGTLAILGLLAGIGATTRMAYIATAAKKSAEENERVLEEVASFQAAQLGGIDVPQMGEHFKTMLLADVQESLANKQNDDSTSTALSMEAFEAALEQANFTTLASNTLDQSVLQQSLKSINTQFEDRPIVRARLLNALASTMNQLGRPEPSLPLLEDALEIRRRELGEDHPDTLEMHVAIGTLLSALGRQEESVAQLRETVARCERVLGADHSRTLGAKNVYGGALRRMGKHAEAQEVWEATLAGRRRTLGDDDSDTMNSLNNVAVIYALQGKYDEAEDAWRELLDRRKRVFGEHHRTYYGSLSNLGLLLLDQGKLEEASELLEKALASLRADLGDDHPSTLLTMGSVAQLRLELEDIDGATALYEEGVASRARTLGPEHPNTLRAKVSICDLYRATDKRDVALEKLRDVVEVQQRVLGADHIDLIVSKGLLAHVLAEVGQVEAAETVYRQIIDQAERIMDPKHGMRGECLSRFGSFLRKQGDLDEAESLLLTAYDVLAASFGPDSDNAQRTASELAKLYEAKFANLAGAHGETVELWKQRSSEYKDPSESDESDELDELDGAGRADG